MKTATTSGYSGTPLVKKLGIKEGMNVLLIDAPDHYHSLLAGVPDGVKFTSDSGAASEFDVIHCFVVRPGELEHLFARCRDVLRKDGSLWMSWRKGKAAKESGLNENVIRDEGLAAGLVDVKVAAVDDEWSGLKFVYRKKDR